MLHDTGDKREEISTGIISVFIKQLLKIINHKCARVLSDLSILIKVMTLSQMFLWRNKKKRIQTSQQSSPELYNECGAESI